MEVKSLLIAPKFEPPDTYAKHVADKVNHLLNDHTHVIIVDSDTVVPKDFYDLPKLYPGAEIIAPRVIPTSLVYRVWETLTYWIRLNRLRLRGCAVIYSTEFLKRVGGYPEVTAPDTWLGNRAVKIAQVPMKAYHTEAFNVRHSISTQVRSGKARAELKQSVWRVAAHSLFRVRPLVLVVYLYQRIRNK